MITTVGKIIFNEIMPPEFPYLNEPTDFNLTVQTPDKYFVEVRYRYSCAYQRARISLTIQEEKSRKYHCGSLQTFQSN